jgi:serine/threonine protein kinase
MGEVYRAKDTRLERSVAIKILPAQFSADPVRKQRFEREAKTISSLNHPHICVLYDVGHQDGIDYLVMECVEGETLAKRLEKGPLPLEQVLRYGAQIADALDKAHRSGVVHRDLKPGNIVLAPGGAKLLDFGLAKPVSPLASGMTLTADTARPAMTEEGTIVGTFQYMSPEQVEGKELDGRSDIFSLGAVLYEMVTGQRAFEGKSQLSVASAILEKEPQPINTVKPLSPPLLNHVIRKCLAKVPDERWQSASDLASELKWITEGGAQAELPAFARRASRLGWLAAGVLLVALVASVAAYLNLASRPSSLVNSSILPPPGTSFVTMTPNSGPAVLSPDGTQLAFTARDEKGKVLLYVRALTSVSAQPLAGTEDAEYPFWALDNRQIGFFVPGKLMKIDSNGGSPQTVCEANNGRGGAWSKKGVIVFNPRSISPLLRVSQAGGVPEPASKLTASETDHRWPQFLPDGKHFLFWARGSTGLQDSALHVGVLGSLQAKAILKGTTMAAYASGYLLFMRDTKLVAQPFDVRRTDTAGEAVSIVEGVTLNELSGRPAFSVSENGTLVYQSNATPATWNLLWFTRDGKQVGSITHQGSPYFSPSLSPDGDRLAVFFVGNLGTQQGVWVFDLQRGTRTRITFESGIQNTPLWAPDGKTMFYGSNSGGVNHIYAKAADGSGSVRTILASADASESPTSVSPDGRYLVYDRRALTGTQTSHDLWVLPLFGDGKLFSHRADCV